MENIGKVNKNTTQVINVQSRDIETNTSYNFSVSSYLGHLSVSVFKRVDGTSSLLFRQPIQPFIAHTVMVKKFEKLLKMEPGGEDSFSLKEWSQEEKKWNVKFTMSFKRNQENKPIIMISAKDKPTVRFIIQMNQKLDLPNVSEHNKSNLYIESLIDELKTGTQRAIIASLLLMKQ